MIRKVLSLVLLLSGRLIEAQVMQPSPPRQQPNSPPSSAIVILSDMHMGFGETDAGDWNPLEDARWSGDFVLFLTQMDNLSKGRMTLVLAGDTFELWQSDSNDCRSAAPTLGCSEAEVLVRLRRILTAHRVDMEVLGSLAAHGENRLVFVPGNHDAAILFPEAWKLIRRSLRCGSCESVSLASDGYWISPGSRVFVEHGHQADRANAFPSWPAPFANDAAGVQRLYSPFGERLVREFFDRYEAKYPVIDNISANVGVLEAMKLEGVAGTASAAAEFFKLLALRTSLRQLTEFLGDSAKPPVWDVAAIQANEIDAIRTAIPPDDAGTPLISSLLTRDANVLNGAFTAASSPSADELRILCQSRYVIYLQQSAAGVAVAQRQTLCPTTQGDLGYLAGKAVNALRGYDAELYNRITDVLHLPALAGLQGRLVYVYGHTHSAAPPTSPLIPALRNVTVVNTGAWQRLVSGDTVTAHYPNGDAIAHIKMDDLPPCYSFVWIKFQLTEPLDPQLTYWSYNKDRQSWGFAPACEEREHLVR